MAIDFFQHLKRNKNKPMELYKKYRPKKMADVVGQEGAVAALSTMMNKNKVPHCLLLVGPSGCGKTTVARILKRHLNCGDHDFYEINAAEKETRGINLISDIQRKVGLSPISGDVKIWLIDEAHKLTGDAQNSLLKLLEDTPSHVYFVLATTDPHKLIKTIHTRSSEVKLALLSVTALEACVQRVADLEKITLSEEVMDELVACAEGSARKALVLLGQIADLEGDETRIKALSVSSQTKAEAINLARALLANAPWGEVSKILKGLDDEAESVRYLVLGFARTVLLGGGQKAPRAYLIIDCFARNFYDSKLAGLAAACWEVCTTK